MEQELIRSMRVPKYMELLEGIELGEQHTSREV